METRHFHSIFNGNDLKFRRSDCARPADLSFFPLEPLYPCPYIPPMTRRKSDTAHLTPFHQCVVDVIRKIPRGRVATYGQIAALAGAPRASRQVVRILHACSEKLELPWYRVINKQGRISLPQNGGYELQKSLLRKEGVKFTREDVIDLTKFGWRP